jgi:TolB protein
MVGHGSPRVADTTGRSVRSPSPGERKRIRLAPTASQWSSTDGKFLAGDGDFDENWYVVRVFTLRGTLATFRWSDDYSPTWSPDGQKIAFVRMQKTEQIFVLDTAGNDLRRLAAGTNPAWSPDGKWIAFERKNEIFVVPSRGGTARSIGKGRHPAWSPDSLSLAATYGGLFVISRDGERRLRIDRPGGSCGGGGAELPNGRPAWSHDGRLLAFSRWVQACQTDELAVAGSDGHFQRVLAEGDSPQWSPDDKQITFINGLEHLAVIPAAGGSARVLDSGLVWSFALAPDRPLVAYTLDAPDRMGTDIWLVQTDGSDRRPLLQGGSDGDPAWRP